MPLLKRKRLEPLKTPHYDPRSKESRKKTVWYSPVTNEIFTDYSEYLQRTTLYKKPIWQCESTGKANLTYKEALESEKLQKERVQEKFPPQLQKRILLYLQFKTARLDAIVDDVYQHLVNRFAVGELVYCEWDDNISYNATVLKVIDGSNLPPAEREKKNIAESTTGEYYKVQLIDENGEGIDDDDCIRIVPSDKLRRERFAFSKAYLKKYIKEYTTKDTYIGAPWLARPDIAERLKIDTTLPMDLQAAKDVAYSKSRRRRQEAAAAAANAANDDTQTTANETATEEKKKPIIIDARRLEATLKYPMEDLNIPMYRRDPSGMGNIVDMTPGTEGQKAVAQNPTGDMPLRPTPPTQPTVPDDCYGSFLMVWSFLSVFSQPLRLSPFSLDDFENALRHNSHTTIMTESNVALLNAIIKQRDRLKKESLGHGSMALAAQQSLYGTGYQASRMTDPVYQNPSLASASASQYNSEDDADFDSHTWKAKRPSVTKRIPTVERGCGSAEVEAITFNWDNGTVDTEEERIGWEDILIGFINQLAPIEQLPEVDRILSHLVPSATSTLEEREQAYISLSLRDKIKIFELLLSVANESYVIKNYMDECQDQLTELRKQKIDLSRERKRIEAERRELDEKQNEENRDTPEVSESVDDNDLDDESDSSDNDDTALLKAQQQLSRHESRQAAMKRKQAEMERREAKRIKLHHLKREEARARSQELKQRNEARKRLDEDERAMLKKVEQVERELRKYHTHRIKPLGRDKFYNRYYYLDDVGGTLLHGSGKLFVQCPSDIDLKILQERDEEGSIDQNAKLPCGRGGGVSFAAQLMKAQGMERQADFLERRVAALKQGTAEPLDEWWETFEDPDDIQKLLEWLNPKGLREFRLKRELEKQFHNITNGMKKRVSDQIAASRQEATRRTTRSKTIQQYPPGSFLAYTNKLS
ncbi:ATP-utilizing chromatin assembly and remodelling N-terminal-domain-containing protein [Mycotypha africana]|uniref:ATP-utilizing chromatin assembly and remodelling N-terminal-domain-containing protein n=1 Tax=Mycotypha africana TaxID=64632 RepID=UPI0023002287|nr:ATP-utilizing chromatin assembly and remodelling N-terminal-domain-containing protein [Mycotypha africana]KAI8971567.1 ATP-utilizing chromatin assembly and remodelling N-terminal-domain-containing protein [Mycotypha africana]